GAVSSGARGGPPRRAAGMGRDVRQERRAHRAVLRQLRHPAARARLHRAARRPGPRGGDQARDPQCELSACPPAPGVRPAVRRALAARVRVLRPHADAPRRPDTRRRQAPARLRLLRSDHLLPAGGQGRAHDRADGDREPGDAGRVRRGNARHRGGGPKRPADRPDGAAPNPARPPRRDARCTPAGAALAAIRGRLSVLAKLTPAPAPGSVSAGVQAPVLNTKVLVLNRSYLPVNITSVRRALSLLYQDIARAVDEQYRTFDFASWADLAAHEETIGLVDRAIRVPRV